MSINIWWEHQAAGNDFFWRPPWLKAGVSGRSRAGPSCGGCACVTSSSPWAHRGVKPGEAEAKGHQVGVINTHPRESPTVLAHLSQRNFLFLTSEASETWSRNHIGVFWHTGSGNWRQIGKFWWVCTRSCLWLAHVSSNRGRQKMGAFRIHLLASKEREGGREEEREREREMPCKTNYSPGKLCSRELIILKSKGPIS